jgi:ADP-ribose pyrophosphatase YjhB (NUDIX family)
MKAARRTRSRTRPIHSFPCARCGRPIRRTEGGKPRRLRCPRCRYLIYDYPRIAAGTVVLKRGSVLLLRRAHPPRRGCLDIPGGFVDAGETIEGAARRELREETGLTVGKLRWLGSYWDRYYIRGFGFFPTMNFYFFGRWRSGLPRAADDAASAEWVPIARLGRRGSLLAWRHMTEVFREVRRRQRNVRRRA